MICYDDILGEKEKKEESKQTKDGLIRALKYNVKKKQNIIEDLFRKITELERQIENQNQGTHPGI